MDSPDIAPQGTAFVTSRKGGKGKGVKKYLPNSEWNALSAFAKAKLIKAPKKDGPEELDKDYKSVLSSK